MFFWLKFIAAESYVHIGFLFAQKGDKNQALEYFKDAINIFERLKKGKGREYIVLCKKQIRELNECNF